MNALMSCFVLLVNGGAIQVLGKIRLEVLNHKSSTSDEIQDHNCVNFQENEGVPGFE